MRWSGVELEWEARRGEVDCWKRWLRAFRRARLEPGTNPARALCQFLRPEPAQDAIGAGGAGSKHPNRAMQPRFIDCSRI